MAEMIRAHKIRIYPNAEQEAILRQHVGAARFVYNWTLGTWNKWVEDKKNGIRDDNPNWIKLSRMWTKEKPEWAKSCPHTVATYALKAVNVAFTRHFKLGLGVPKFKKKGMCKDVFRASGDKCWVRDDGRHIHIVGVKTDIRMAERLRLSGPRLSYTVCRTAGRWFVSVLVDIDDTRTAPESTCGVDVGMKTNAVCSDGTKLTLPKEELARLDKRLRRAQHIMSRRNKESRRRAKALLRCQRIRERYNNIRRDRLNKFTSSVCKNHATVVFEHLTLTGMHHAHKHVRKGVHRSCMSEILRQLGYKAIHPVQADMWYPSTQLCSQCGQKQKMKLSQRTYKCPHCGLTIDRDLNAAICLSKYPGSQG